MFRDRIDSERLFLRPVVAADAPALFAGYASDLEVARFTTWRPHAALADTERFLAACAAATASRTLAIVLRDSDAAIGVMDLRRPVPSRMEVGYALARTCWGQGLMTEALRAATGWAFAKAALWRVVAIVDAENRASARVMEKAGLQREGLLRRWIVHLPPPAIGRRPLAGPHFAVQLF